jgi:hypothetical protein
MLPINNQALVCSGTNDMSSTSVPGTLCGSGATGSYKDGNEALYRFTPTVTGQYLITLSSFSSWTAIMVYDGCPTNNLCIGTISSSANGVKNLAVNLTAGTTYYIWFDLWPVPSTSPCPGTFFLKLQAAVNNNNSCSGPLTPSPDENCTALSTRVTSLNGADASVVAEGPAMPCGGNPDNDVWFRFVPTSTSHLFTLSDITSSNAAAADFVIALYRSIGPCLSTSTAPTWNYVTCVRSSVAQFTGLTLGVPYFIRVFTYGTKLPTDYTYFTACITTIVPTVCDGNFYDLAGPNANYTDGANYSTTYCPPAGQVATLIFSQFNTEFADHVRIYNGPTTASPLIGDYTGTTLPPVATSTAAGGCLTLGFTSDATVTRPGWVGTMFCNPAPIVGPGKCTYALRMHDGGGDGWGAAYVEVRVEGSLIGTHTVNTYDNYILFNVDIGDEVSLTYYKDPAPTANESQNSYSVSKLGQAPYWSAYGPPLVGETFVQTVGCGPPPNVPQDCYGGITVCSASGFTTSSPNTGNFADLPAGPNRGCMSSGERQGTWYYFSPQTTGTIGFTITPAGSEDYDFGLWGPYPSAHCPTSPPIRCSYAAPSGSYVTGLGNGAVDLSEGAGGDGWVAPIAITGAEIGKVYALYVDNFSSNGQSFSLSWQFGGGASLDCAPLPVELVELEAHPQGQVINVDWATATERDNDHFTVQHSVDNVNFENIGQVAGAGNTVQRSEYRFTDTRPAAGWNYYRLQQVDFNGSATLSYVVAANMDVKDGGKPILYPNPVEDVLNVQWAGETKGVTLIVRDALGRTVASGAPLNTYGAALQLPVDHLTGGCYTVGIALPNGQEIGGGVFIKR